MQITQTEFKKLADEVYYDEAPVIAIDFETNGLNPYDRDEAFVIGIAYQDRTFSYFLTDQFKDGNILARLLGNSKGAYLAHNAKFEMSFLLNQWGVQISGVVWDTEVFAKTLNNSYGKKTGGTGYGLQACAERIGLSKYPPMLAWLKKKGNKHAYHKAPKDLIIPYVEQDAYLSLALYKEQVAQFNEWQKGPVPIGDIVKLEMTTTKSLFQMERRGLLLDLEYCREALGYERGKAERAKERFKDITGCEFSDSGKLFTKIFDERGVKYAMTAPTKRFPNGQPSFAEESLEAMGDEPVAQCIRDYRTANKRASTYWGNFITGSPNGEVHPNIKQTGADTFRMSVINPACQTWPRDDEDDLNYPIRRAFKAKPNCKVLSMDYRQMELRMMADESGDKDMIQAIMEGQDLHQKTADIAGVKRSLAKNGRGWIQANR
jgi:DNA polymerase-1